MKARSTPGIYRIRQLAQSQQFLKSAEKVIAEIVINPVVGGDYLINNAIYCETEVPIVVNLNDAEEWRL